MLRSFALFIAALFLLTSCEKDEKALVLPPPGANTAGSVDMGVDYDKQVFYDFYTGKAVLTNSPNTWDLAFEATQDGRHVYMNGGDVGIQMYNTHEKSMDAVKTLPPECSYYTGLGWRTYDDPNGLPNKTAIGDWADNSGNTKGDIYILQNRKGITWKMRLLSVSGTSYAFEWSLLNSTSDPIQVRLDKDTNYNFVYFSFANGLVKPEPPKTTWDVVFTRYRYIYRNYQNYQGKDYDFEYTVSGALLNPYHTTAGADSTSKFEDITLQTASSMPLSTYRDVIGSDWKQVDLNNAYRYTVKRWKNYVLQTQKDHLYKLHFLEYYNSAGEKGHPLFEYKRLK